MAFLDSAGLVVEDDVNCSIQRCRSLLWELYLGIHTTGFAAPTVEFGVHYTPLPYEAILEILAELVLDANDVFVDIGCGKGRVICCASRRLLRGVVGIEVNDALVQVARSNANRVRRRRTPISILPVLAQDYDYADATAICLYNPFGAPIMEKVAARLEQSFRRNPRKIQIAYANCVHERIFGASGWLVCRKHWPPAHFPDFGCPISFWEARV